MYTMKVRSHIHLCTMTFEHFCIYLKEWGMCACRRHTGPCVGDKSSTWRANARSRNCTASCRASYELWTALSERPLISTCEFLNSMWAIRLFQRACFFKKIRLVELGSNIFEFWPNVFDFWRFIFEFWLYIWISARPVFEKRVFSRGCVVCPQTYSAHGYFGMWNDVVMFGKLHEVRSVSR